MWYTIQYIAAIAKYGKQECQGRWCIFDTGWSHWIDYLVKEDMMKVAWPGSNQIILVSGLKIVAKSQSELWRLITNSSAKFKADPVSGVYAKGYHIGTRVVHRYSVYRKTGTTQSHFRFDTPITIIPVHTGLCTWHQYVTMLIISSGLNWLKHNPHYH